MDKQSIENWYSSQINEILSKNVQSFENWSKYKSDTETTKSNLKWLPKKLSHNVLVPVGPRGFMPGKIVHTNEILVNIGENWFVKKTAAQAEEVCDRRIKSCEEILEKLEKERDLLEQRQVLPVDKEAFGSEDRPEIIEEVTEDEYQKLKIEHEQKEREYRKKLRDLKKKEKTVVETEEDLWKRLDELELIEELEDELSKLNEDETDVEDESSGDETDNQEVQENKERNNKISSKCVSFDDKLKTLDQVLEDEPLILNFQHTDANPSFNVFKPGMENPGDIFKQYKQNLKVKSILKNNKNPNISCEIRNVEILDNANDFEPKTVTQSNFEILDVVEKNEKSFKIDVGVGVEKSKKMSKFKLSRMKAS